MKMLMPIAVVGLAASLSSADFVFETQYELQDGALVATNLGDTESYRAFLADVFELYEPLRGKKLAEQMEAQRKHQIRTSGTIGEFGEMGDDVQFNPLATGGTVDIPSGGGLIDIDTPGGMIAMEISTTGVEPNVFRQDFGPVQTNQRVRLAANPSEFSFTWLALRPWDTDLLDVDASGRTQTLEVRLFVVPAPSATGAFLVGYACASPRRRRRA